MPTTRSNGPADNIGLTNEPRKGRKKATKETSPPKDKNTQKKATEEQKQKEKTAEEKATKEKQEEIKIDEESSVSSDSDASDSSEDSFDAYANARTPCKVYLGIMACGVKDKKTAEIDKEKVQHRKVDARAYICFNITFAIFCIIYVVVCLIMGGS